jgi:hypothetical protein
MELADALAISTTRPERSMERPTRRGWYDPDSVAFLESTDRTAGGWTRVSGARRLEIAAALPPGLRPLSLLVRVRRESRESPAPRRSPTSR